MALVTGASSGLGRAFSIALAKAGASVLLVARREELLREAVEEIVRAGGDAAYHVADVRVVPSLYDLVDVALARFKKINILTNNAGLGYRAPLSDLKRGRDRRDDRDGPERRDLPDPGRAARARPRRSIGHRQHRVDRGPRELRRKAPSTAPRRPGWSRSRGPSPWSSRPAGHPRHDPLRGLDRHAFFDTFRPTTRAAEACCVSRTRCGS